jgi:hypothetical protein
VCKAQQASQRDAPPVGGFGVRFFIKVRRLHLAFVSGAPLTVTLGHYGEEVVSRQNPLTETETQVRVSKYSRDGWVIVECPETGMVYLQNPPDYSQLVDEFA